MRRRIARSLAVVVTLLVAVATVPVVEAGSDSAYGRLLAKHVRPGQVGGIRLNLVDYQAVARDPDYREALGEMARANPKELSSKEERFAFWVNAYNLLAIKTVLDRYPISSIKDGGNFLFPIWKKNVGTVAGKDYSLDDIEHGVLRARFEEPRVHFAVVCASLSCPDLRAEPYEGIRLDEQLGDQARSFLENRTKGLVPGDDRKTAAVSSIFKWFGEDFDRGGGVAQFIREHVDEDTKREISGLTDGGISYLDYDWSLNDTARE